MQRVHRVAAATMSSAVITAIMLTGCSTSNSDSNSSTSSSVQTTVIADPAAQVRAAADNTAALSGAHLQLDVAGEVPNLNAKSVVADINTNPYAAKGTATVVFGRVAPREIQAPFVYIENTLYANVDNAGFLGYGDGRSIYDVSVILNKDKGLANVLRNLTNPVKSGTETIDGVETAKISGQVKASVLAQLTGPRATVPGRRSTGAGHRVADLGYQSACPPAVPTQPGRSPGVDHHQPDQVEHHHRHLAAG